MFLAVSLQKNCGFTHPNGECSNYHVHSTFPSLNLGLVRGVCWGKRWGFRILLTFIVSGKNTIGGVRVEYSSHEFLLKTQGWEHKWHVPSHFSECSFQKSPEEKRYQHVPFPARNPAPMDGFPSLFATNYIHFNRVLIASPHSFTINSCTAKQFFLDGFTCFTHKMGCCSVTSFGKYRPSRIVSISTKSMQFV